jgi:hypothetical protein
MIKPWIYDHSPLEGVLFEEPLQQLKEDLKVKKKNLSFYDFSASRHSFCLFLFLHFCRFSFSFFLFLSLSFSFFLFLLKTLFSHLVVFL